MFYGCVKLIKVTTYAHLSSLGEILVAGKSKRSLCFNWAVITNWLSNNKRWCLQEYRSHWWKLYEGKGESKLEKFTPCKRKMIWTAFAWDSYLSFLVKKVEKILLCITLNAGLSIQSCVLDWCMGTCINLEKK